MIEVLRPSNTGLLYIRNRTFLIRFFAAYGILLVAIQVLFFFLQFNHAQDIEKSIHGILRNEILMKEPYRIAQSITDLEAMGLLKCSVLKDESQNLEFQNLHYKHPESECTSSFLKLNGVVVQSRTTSINGHPWSVKFISGNPPAFHWLLWITRVSALLTLSAILLVSEKYTSARLASIELEKQHLSDLNRLARQVAHDIRSPLAALTAIEQDLLRVPEETRLVLHSAIERIRDIASNLMQKDSEATKSTQRLSVSSSVATEIKEPLGVHLLSSLIEPLLAEKRIQYRGKIGIDISCRFDSISYGLFVKTQPNEFKRVLSNLINNAVEAIQDQGRVDIELASNDGQALISIADTGIGITPDLLPKLGEYGVTHGKKSGSGLGLFHARTSVEHWGGSLKINSEPGRGTVVMLILPREPAPDWFATGLEIRGESHLVIVDDDASIHRIWQGRFDSLRLRDKNIQVHHFPGPVETTAWVINNPFEAEKALFLVDYEFMGNRTTAIELIQNLNLNGQSILVTSHFDESNIREAALRIGVRMIPKGMAGFLPISVLDS